jgi:hypothetical protein
VITSRLDLVIFSWTMTQSDSEDEGVDDLEFDRTTDIDAEEEVDEDIEGADDATEGDDVCCHFEH